MWVLLAVLAAICLLMTGIVLGITVLAPDARSGTRDQEQGHLRSQRQLVPEVGSNSSPQPVNEASSQAWSSKLMGLEIVNAEAPLQPEAWSEFDGETYLTLAPTAMHTSLKSDDADDVTVLAWIYLSDDKREGNSKTVVATKAGGCSAGASNAGFALFVNSWLTNDRKLVLEWGSADGKCELLAPPATIPSREWVHVGFTLSGGVTADGKATLYLKGQVVGSAVIPAGTRSLQQQSGVQMRIGMHTNDEFGFTGRLAHVLVLHSAITPQQLYHAMKVRDGAIVLHDALRLLADFAWRRLIWFAIVT